MTGRSAIGCAALIASSSPLSAQTSVTHAADPYVQTQTGFSFPARIAGAVRHQVVRYDDTGADIGVGYQLQRSGTMVAYVSVFVYPAPVLGVDTPALRAMACRKVFAGIERDIMAHEVSAQLTKEGSAPSLTSTATSIGLRAIYTGGHTKFYGTDRVVREQADLFCYQGSRWLISYRITSPADIDAKAEVDAFTRALVWPADLTR